MEKFIVRSLILFLLGMPSCREELLIQQAYEPCHEDILEEMRLGDMELIAQVVHAEAGNQDLEGKRLVADVILNRVESDKFPDTVEEVIFQDSQFSVIFDGAFDKAAWNIEESDYEAVRLEYESPARLDGGVLYFGTEKFNGKNFYKHGGHWFSY